MNHIRIILTTFFTIIIFSISARNVTGTVKEKSGEPAIGASIKWAGGPAGTITDHDGHFSLSTKGRTKSIEVSYPGFATDTISVTSDEFGPIEIVIIPEEMLDEVIVTSKRAGQIRSKGVFNESLTTQAELCKAACCNLGESFTTNPSVDVSYSDAATGARQIKLLGLSGAYVQMLSENMPDFRGPAAPYALGYVPGPWMQSIQVSKGSSSVKNGYESITGQINLEYLKPQSERSIHANLFGSTEGKIEVNADANTHVSDKVSTGLMLHYEDGLIHHDGNSDGFMDSPDVRQINAINRWGYFSDNYVFQGGFQILDENRQSGQVKKMHDGTVIDNPFKIELKTGRYRIFTKNAYIFNHEKNTNIALILSGTLHNMDANYGLKTYKVNQRNLYASLIFETEFSQMHSLSAGLSLNHDYYRERVRHEQIADAPTKLFKQPETVAGAYAQYTFNLSDMLTAMAGIRADHSSRYGWFVTPRAHIKFAPAEWFSLRASVGKGYRSVYALAENNFLLSSGRLLVVDAAAQEAAWNYGASAAFTFNVAERPLNINLEYYYTDFLHQTIVDYDSWPGEIHVTDLHGKSYSHTFQADVSYTIFRGMSLTAAWRINDVKATYNGVLRTKPLTSKYKGLLTASYTTPLGLWQFDATMQLNGGGRMPTPAKDAQGNPLWPENFKAFPQLNAQITRWFRNWSIYIGGENLTNFKQKNPIINAHNPWSSTFDPTMIWGPVHGIMGYIGLRINF
ncbi:MAG: TonB-dependent receptor [Prevotella sp.]|nr:TonB-dependent receptor [Bacteroides sp.]MCM1366273.1 TonB-dependent receptor [Prevotella sp.]MCM1436323.1 TonB-dependent receptor [Prevotella sp.]